MIQIISFRTSVLLLPLSKLVLRPNVPTTVVAMTDEIRKAVAAGWVKVVETPSPTPTSTPITPLVSQPATTDAPNPIVHDWLIDYAGVESGTVTISDRSTGKSLVAEIAERKGDQHFTLKNFGTVKAQQWWPTAQALERFDATV